MKYLFTNKEISWLSFNDRVLQEAADPSVPLYERIKFMGIYSSNLDEFFRVRVATLQRLSALGTGAKKLIGIDPDLLLKQVQQIVIHQHVKFQAVYQDIVRQLAREKIYIINEHQLNDEQADFVRAYFHDKVRPRLFPIILDEVEKIPDLIDESIYLAVAINRKNEYPRRKSALIEVPTRLISRFVILPRIRRSRYIILLDDVIRFNLNAIFAMFKYDDIKAYTVKLTRDAELDIADDMAQSLIKKISKGLKQRREGNPVRFIYDVELPDSFLQLFIKQLGLDDKDTLIPGARYHNFKDFMNFPDFGLTHWKYEPIRQLHHRYIKPGSHLFQFLKEKDLLLHYPYQTFDYVIDLLREASIDPQVTSIKFTLYRVAKYSSVVNALINAVKNGKEVVVVLELRARFDEEANIYWANKMKEEGVRVIYGVPGLKVHSKLCLISRKKKGGEAFFAIIGTGNYNENTAQIYSDHSLFTANKKLTREVKRIFDFFENNYKKFSSEHLIVSPFDLRKKIVRFVKNEIGNAQAGQEAEIFIKVNNLVDTKIIKHLYSASQAGVQVKLIVRSMFSLVPGVPGLSERIQAISIVDKFLEHSRIFVFHNKGSKKVFISSADLMPRNLDRRIEVTCPIYDEEIKKELLTLLDIQWKDNVRARILNRALDNQYRPGLKTSVRAQWKIYDYLNKFKISHTTQD